MTVQLCVLLWEHPARADDVAAYEDAVLALLPLHGGQLQARSTVMDRAPGDPLEVQLIDLPDETALANFLEDPARAEIARTMARHTIIARTQMLRLR